MLEYFSGGRLDFLCPQLPRQALVIRINAGRGSTNHHPPRGAVYESEQRLEYAMLRTHVTSDFVG